MVLFSAHERSGEMDFSEIIKTGKDEGNEADMKKG
jgi:hypothetical protein